MLTRSLILRTNKPIIITPDCNCPLLLSRRTATAHYYYHAGLPLPAKDAWPQLSHNASSIIITALIVIIHDKTSQLAIAINNINAPTANYIKRLYVSFLWDAYYYVLNLLL